MALPGTGPSPASSPRGEFPPEPFRLEITGDGPRITASVTGPLDVEHTPTFLARVRLRCHPECRVAVDLSGVPYLDSTGVRGLLALKRELEERHGELCLIVSRGSRVEWILRLLQMEQQLGTRPEPEAPVDEPDLLRAN